MKARGWWKEGKDLGLIRGLKMKMPGRFLMLAILIGEISNYKVAVSEQTALWYLAPCQVKPWHCYLPPTLTAGCDPYTLLVCFI